MRGALVGSLVLLVIVLLLAACAHNEPKLATEATTVQVPVPVVTKCIKDADIPPVPRTHMVKGGNIESNAAGASADVRELVAYADQADNLLRQCAAP